MLVNQDLLIRNIKGLQAEEDAIFDANRIKGYGEIFRNKAFEDLFNSFYEKVEKGLRSLPQTQLLIDEVGKWIERIEYKIKTNESSANTIKKIHVTYWKKLKANLSSIEYNLPILKKEDESIKVLTDSAKKVKRTDYNKSDFTAKQTGLLMLYLKQNKVFLQDITDKKIHECFETLTGHSSKQFKKK